MFKTLLHTTEESKASLVQPGDKGTDAESRPLEDPCVSLVSPQGGPWGTSLAGSKEQSEKCWSGPIPLIYK